MNRDEPEPRADYVPLYQVATRRLLEYIVANHLAPGDRLPTEREFAEILGMSHTVVREAIKVLSAIGRITVRKRAGLFVADPNPEILPPGNDPFLPSQPDQVRQLFDYRRIIESQAAALAASTATPAHVTSIQQWAERSMITAQQDDFSEFRIADRAFHRCVAVASNNIFVSRAADAIDRYKGEVLRIGLHDRASGSLIEAAEQHRAIADAIARGETESASTLSVEHVEIAKRQYLDRIQEALDALTENATRAPTPAT